MSGELVSIRTTRIRFDMTIPPAGTYYPGARRPRQSDHGRTPGRRGAAPYIQGPADAAPALDLTSRVVDADHCRGGMGRRHDGPRADGQTTGSSPSC